MQSLRAGLVQRVAGLLASDPERIQTAIEVGLVRREWLENPLGEPVSTTAPREVMQRFLEREVERNPSTLLEMGVSALQILKSSTDDESVGGVASPLAIVFTDLEGFTSFTATNGDEAASELLRAHGLTVGPIIRSRGGRIVKHLGDGLLVTFPEPEAAALACLELVESVPGPLAMRAGAHWGMPVATRDDVIGHDVNLAARVTETARGGEVLVTDELRQAVTGLAGVRFGRLVQRSVKGLGERVKVCRLERDPDAVPHHIVGPARPRARRRGG